MRVKHELETKKNTPWCVKWCDATKWLIPCCTTILFFLSNFFDLSLTAFELSVSSLLCANTDSNCFWFVVQNWKIPPQNGNLLLRIETLHGIIILSLRIELIERSVLLIHCDCWICSLTISPLVPLNPVVGLRPPSIINSLCNAASLTLCISLCSVQNTTPKCILSECWCSLSLWHTHYPNWCMA